MDWMREHGRDSWTGDVGATSGGSAGEKQRRRDSERNRNDEELDEEDMVDQRNE
jgi:hypothetical protein